MGTGECNAGDNLAMDQLAIPAGVDASCCRNRDKLWPDEPGGLFADLPSHRNEAEVSTVVSIE